MTSIAQTVLSQIKAMDPMALFAWGVKDIVNTGKGLQFKTSGMTPWKGHVHIVLDEAMDLYNVEFYRIRAGKIKTDKQVNGVYVNELISVIDSFVG
jgi:hypothetical protein